MGKPKVRYRPMDAMRKDMAVAKVTEEDAEDGTVRRRRRMTKECLNL